MSDKDIIDEMFSDIGSLMRPKDESPENDRTITLWVPDSYKVKFDELQDRTNKEFGKKLKELIYLAIDKAISN